MTQWLRIHLPLAEDPSSVPIPMWCGLTTLSISISMDSSSLLWPPQALHSYAKKPHYMHNSK